MMNPVITLAIFAIAIGALVVLTARFKFHAFIVILLITVLVGLAAGLNPGDVIGYIVEGFGGMLGYTGIVVVCGIIIGEFLEKTGATVTIAETVIGLVGRARATLATAISGYILAVPVMCCDTAFVILSPIARALAAGGGISLSGISIALAVGTYTSFKFIPPSPGPLAILTTFGADFGKTLVLSFLVSIPVFAVGMVWAYRRSSRVAAEPRGASFDEIKQRYERLPNVYQSFAPILVPVLLIILKSATSAFLATEGVVGGILDFIGHPVIALPIGVISLMVLNREAGMEKITGWTSEAITRSASILVIVGVGGALGEVLRHTGIGDYLGDAITRAGLPGLVVPFLLAAALKTAQGSSLVTMFTTPAIVLPFLPSLGLSPEIATLATCAGALAVVHANDSFFWVVTGFGEMDVPAGYRSLTVVTLLQGIIALPVVWALSLVT
jgi:GntP family gluconate:H+ symporter